MILKPRIFIRSAVLIQICVDRFSISTIDYRAIFLAGKNKGSLGQASSNNVCYPTSVVESRTSFEKYPASNFQYIPFSLHFCKFTIDTSFDSRPNDISYNLLRKDIAERSWIVLLQQRILWFLVLAFEDQWKKAIFFYTPHYGLNIRA